MIAAHFTAVRELLAEAAAGIQVYDTDASEIVGDPDEYPFFVLSGGTVRGFSDSLGGRGELVEISRAALEGAALAVPGRHGWELALDDSQDIEIDRDVRLNGAATSAFPYFAVDIYRLGSTRYG